MTIQTEAGGPGAVEPSVATPARFQPARTVLPVLLAIAAVTLLSFRGFGPVVPGIDPSCTLAFTSPWPSRLHSAGKSF